MQFCEECGSMMKARDDEMVCTSCGHTAEQEADFVTTESQRDDDVVETSEEEAFGEAKPTAEETCERCGNDLAYYTIKQTASADEPPSRFFKCTECGYRWREYG